MSKKLLFLFFVITIFCVIYSVAEEISDKSDKDTEITPRRRKHLYSALFPLVGLGGLHAISAFVAIKLKLVIVFILIVATAFFGFKVWTGGALFGCKNHGPEIIHEGPIIPYDSGHIVPHTSPDFSYSGGYSGPDPYSAWNPETIGSGPPSGGEIHHDHHDHHDHLDFHHDDHHDAPDIQHSKRRVAYQGTAGARQSSGGFDWTSLAFAVLGVDTMVCRKRFTCEMEVQSKNNPFFGFAYNYLSRGMWSEYRNYPEIPHSLSDCARLFKECYSPADDQVNEKNTTEEESSTDESIEDVVTPEANDESSESLGRQMLMRRISRKLHESENRQ
ncbi:uncharacterized protein LOC129792124 [Lutzomyia longipalpis]|uniref:uncharacterized protein LOC129792124 n=1 Tax=Lutzomyia longipalpis TaxID=7200 RepID=UPI0024836F46|nr:uncharacterized protein LOC129792124 [Lutzomyia longipalpis]